jgi:hypothetical protein
MSITIPVAEGLWTNEDQPRLIGGRDIRTGEIVFPMPEGDAAEHFEPVALSRNGTLWSWTSQDFRPKSPPYAGPEEFVPYLLGYVELPGEVIVESRIVDARLEDLHLGMELEFCIVPFNLTHDTFAFRPLTASESKAA